MIMGDFNHPGRNWNYLESAADSEAFLLLMQDCFLTQHVLAPVRGGNVLDIVLSSQEELINDLRILEPLGKSGHSQIHFNLMINTGNGRSKQKKRDFHRGDYINKSHTHLLQYGCRHASGQRAVEFCATQTGADAA